MRRRLLVPALLLLAGCGGTSAETSQAEPSSSAPVATSSSAAPTTTATDADLVFRQYVIGSGLAQSGTVDELHGVASSACAAFDRGSTWDQAANAVTSSGTFTQYQAGQLLGIAVAVYCPIHSDVVPSR